MELLGSQVAEEELSENVFVRNKQKRSTGEMSRGACFLSCALLLENVILLLQPFQFNRTLL